MNEHEPWHPEHEPIRYKRTDPTGRHSPLYVREEKEPSWLLFFGTLFFACLFAVIFFFGV